MSAQICVFEDTHVGRMYPLSLTRPVFLITVAGYTLWDIVGMAARDAEEVEVGAVVRPYLAETVLGAVGKTPPPAGEMLYLNGSLVPDAGLIQILQPLLAPDGVTPFLCTVGQRIAAARVPSDAVPPAHPTPESLTAFLLEQNLPLRDDLGLELLDHPFDTIRKLEEVFPGNLDRRLAEEEYREIRPGVFAGAEVQIADSAVFHTSDGPVVLDPGVHIMDFCFLEGPVIVGAESRIIERSSVKEHVSIGKTCKIGGEVEASIVEDFTNKQHHGFLGHAHVGSWVNLGAGTSNSDLKNTYGTIRIDLPEERVDTGMQFFGCAIGDYSKSAINTSIFTGKIIGINSMLYGAVGKNVPSFTNFAASFNQVTECSLEQALQTQRRMFARRHREQTPADVELLSYLFEATREERRLSTEPPVL